MNVQMISMCNWVRLRNLKKYKNNENSVLRSVHRVCYWQALQFSLSIANCYVWVLGNGSLVWDAVKKDVMPNVLQQQPLRIQRRTRTLSTDKKDVVLKYHGNVHRNIYIGWLVFLSSTVEVVSYALPFLPKISSKTVCLNISYTEQTRLSSRQGLRGSKRI